MMNLLFGIVLAILTVIASCERHMYYQTYDSQSYLSSENKPVTFEVGNVWFENHEGERSIHLCTSSNIESKVQTKLRDFAPDFSSDVVNMVLYWCSGKNGQDQLWACDDVPADCQEVVFAARSPEKNEAGKTFQDGSLLLRVSYQIDPKLTEGYLEKSGLGMTADISLSQRSHDQMSYDSEWVLDSAEELGDVSAVSYQWQQQGDGELLVLHRADRHMDEESYDSAMIYRHDTPISQHTVIGYDPETGELTGNRYAAGLTYLPHGINVDYAGNMWISDVGSHQVYKLSPTGELLLTLGVKLEPGNDEAHFCKPTSVAVSEVTGEIFVADGYCNSRVVVFDSSGSYLRELGGDAEMEVVHSITLSQSDQVLFVSDREHGLINAFQADTGDLVGRLYDPSMGSRVFASCFAEQLNGEKKLHTITGPGLDGDGLKGFNWDLDSNDLEESYTTLWADNTLVPFVMPHAITHSEQAVFVADVKSDAKVFKFTL